MPLYEYECGKCQARFERVLPMADYDKPQGCSCGELARRVISPVRVMADLPGYTCPVTGKWIEGRRQHEENLKRHDCHVYDPGEKTQAEKFRKTADDKLDTAIGETVERFIENLPTTKREQLANELDAGADVAFAR